MRVVRDNGLMRDRLILAGLGILLIAAAAALFSLARLQPSDTTSASNDDHGHSTELLPPAPVGRTLFGGNSGELLGSPAAIARATPATRAATPLASPSIDVFAPARFLPTPPGDPTATGADAPQAP